MWWTFYQLTDGKFWEYFAIYCVLTVFSSMIHTTHPYIGIIVSVELQEAEFRFFLYSQKQCFSEELAYLRQGRPRQSSIVQLKPFLGPRGLLCVGCLHLALLDYDEKRPIILPQSRVVTLLIRQEYIQLKHAGLATLITALRTRFWIVGVPRLRQLLKTGYGSLGPSSTSFADRSYPPQCSIFCFSRLYCTDAGDSKEYILLFTCVEVRVVHLEFVYTLNFDDTALAIRRFAARRYIPSVCPV